MACCARSLGLCLATALGHDLEGLGHDLEGKVSLASYIAAVFR